MEERDIQVRGYTLRLPLDVLLVASANPEDYTNRGRIITPLKDRFGAEIRTHYPLEVADEVALVEQEAELVAPVPRHLIEVIARFTRHLRDASAIDQASGVSARFAVAAAETVAAAALRRAAITGEAAAFARPVDLESVPAVLRGKLEFASGEEGREEEVLEHLLRRAIADTARYALRGVNLTALVDGVTTRPVRTGERVPATEVVAALPSVPELSEVATRLGAAGTEDPGPMASAAELALEYLFLTRKLAKDSSDDGDTVSYG
jgi:magnesium chelatase subunit I